MPRSMRLTWSWTTEAAVFPVQSVCFLNRDFISYPRGVWNPSYIPGPAGNLSHFFENELSNGSPPTGGPASSRNRMRELLISITLLSLVSSEEFEPKKRLEIPPEEDPNFWPARGRRSYWSSPRLIGKLIRRDLPQGPDVDYSSHPRSWPIETDFVSPSGVGGFPDNWRVPLCSRKKPISLVLPLEEYPDEAELPGCRGRCSSEILRGRWRRGDERWRRQQPLYAEEPGWIPIDFDHGVLGRSMGDEDPFIVARGKKGKTDTSPDVRERRQLEDVIGTYDADPFFVARGKRDIDSSDEEETAKSGEDRTLGLNSPNEPRRTGDYKKWANSKGAEVSTRKNEKFLKDLDKGRPSTTPGIYGGEKVRHRRPERSSSSKSTPGITQGEREFSVKPRYSGPRDKHSNLQSILDEPFFVSRGKKKNLVDPGVGGYLRYGDEELPNKILEPKSEFFTNFYGETTLPKKSYDDEDIELLAKVFADGLEPFKDQGKPPRSRRGMLDDLLKSNDPFYVARGKRIIPETHGGYFDLVVNEPTNGGNLDGRFSLFAKKTRTKFLQDLSDLSKIRNYPYAQKWNMTNDGIN